MGAGFQIADRAGIEARLAEMARALRAAAPALPRLVGIRRRGVPLAHALAAQLVACGAEPGPVRELGLRRYADDLAVLHAVPSLEAPADLDVRDADVLLVDDVLYTGRTLLRASAHLLEAGARSVRAAVLCERSGLQAPVRAAFVGHRLDVAAGQKIEVRIPPFEPEWGIHLLDL